MIVEHYLNLLLHTGVVINLMATIVVDSLVGKFKVLLNRYGVFDLQKHNRKCDDQAAGK
jgi:hypothetical protein